MLEAVLLLGAKMRNCESLCGIAQNGESFGPSANEFARKQPKKKGSSEIFEAQNFEQQKVLL